MGQRYFDDLQLGSIELFCAAAQHGSFTRAAHTLGLTPAAVSRSVARLEARLNVRLFVRSTRRIRLTDAGQAYYEQCRQALAQLVEAEREVTGQQFEPVGILRISVPTTYGHFRVLPLLPGFRARYPGVQVEAHVSNRTVDFADEGFDLAIRIRPPSDSSLIARLLERAELVVVAAPEYLRRAGIPRTVEDLEQHECIQFLAPSDGRPMPWLLRVDGEDREITTDGAYRCSDDILGCVTLARAGAGLFCAMRYVVAEDLASGRLVQVLDDHAGPARAVSLIYPHRRHTPLRVRAFVDYLFEQLSELRADA